MAQVSIGGCFEIHMEGISFEQNSTLAPFGIVFPWGLMVPD